MYKKVQPKMDPWGTPDKSILTHFRPMFHLRINQVVGFYLQNVWKHLWKSDIVIKDAGRWPAS